MRGKRGASVVLTLALCAACAGQASALEYTMDAPEDYLFGRSTSVEIVYGQEEPLNVDRSKNVSMIPPGFGTPTSYVPGSGEYLTPNLVPDAFCGGLMNAIGTGTSAAGYVSAEIPAQYEGGTAAAYPTGNTGGADSVSYPATVTQTYEPADSGGYDGISFTEVTRDMYYSGGQLGTLKIPSLGVNVKVYQGTDTDALNKGAGHFTETSIWNGNVSLAGHNRGPHGIFGTIHTLKPGAEITLTTKLGTRTYTVESVQKISAADSSDTAQFTPVSRMRAITAGVSGRRNADSKRIISLIESGGYSYIQTDFLIQFQAYLFVKFSFPIP